MQEFIDKLIGRLEEKLGSVNFEKATKEVNESFYEGMAYTYGESIEIIKKLAEQHNNGWISVNDRLPDKEGSYLVIGRTGGATVTRWYAPSQFHSQGHFGGNSADYIRYWMPRPLPPDYKEGGV